MIPGRSPFDVVVDNVDPTAFATLEATMAIVRTEATMLDPPPLRGVEARGDERCPPATEGPSP